jgi:uncharacterized protein with HEPN domain
MAKTPAIYLNDMIDAIRRIESYTKDMSRARFGRDERTQDAVTRCLEVLSEASRRVPDAIWEVTRSHLADLGRVVIAMKKELEPTRGKEGGPDR